MISNNSKSSRNLQTYKNGGVNDNLFNSKFNKRIPFFSKLFDNEHKLNKSKTTVTLGQIYNKDENTPMVQEYKSESTILNSNVENDDSVENDVINILTISENSYCISYIKKSDSAVVNNFNCDNENHIKNKYEYSRNSGLHLDVKSSQKNNSITDNCIDDKKIQINSNCLVDTVSNFMPNSERRSEKVKCEISSNTSNDPNNKNINDNLKNDDHDKIVDDYTTGINENLSNLENESSEYNVCKLNNLNFNITECSNSDIKKHPARNENDTIRNTNDNTDYESKNNELFNNVSIKQKVCPVKSEKSISTELSSAPSNRVVSRRHDDENWKQFLSKLDKIIVNKSSEFL